VLEALQEADETTADCIAINMANIANARSEMEKSIGYTTIGRLLAAMISGYCGYQAKLIAEDEINNASCHRCFDAGCKFCRDNDE